MRAAVRVAPGRVEVVSRPEPVPGPDEVLLRPLLAGVCGGDLMYYLDAGHVAGVQDAYIVCHEVVAEMMESAPGFPAGSRVVIDPLVHCGECADCRRGRPQLCLYRRDRGYGTDGVAADVICAPRDKVFAVPGEVPDDAAAVTHGLAAVLHALDTAEGRTPADGDLDAPTPYRSALVLGPGPAGMMFALVLISRGVETTLAGRPSPRLRHAESLGIPTLAMGSADAPLPSDREDSYDLVVETTGARGVQKAALPLTRRGGTFLLYAPGTFTLDATWAFRREIRVQGSTGVVGRMPAALELLRRRTVLVEKLITHTFPVADADRAFTLAVSPPATRGDLVKAMLDLW